MIVDEVYHPLYFGEAVPSAAGIDNVIVMSDMSKALSLAGLRMGWIIDADPERRKRIIDARSYFTICSSPILETIALHALRNRAQLLAKLTAVASRNLTALSGFMQSFAGTFSWVPPAGGTVVFPWFSDGRDSRPFCQALAAKGVLIAPGDCFARPIICASGLVPRPPAMMRRSPSWPSFPHRIRGQAAAHPMMRQSAANLGTAEF